MLITLLLILHQVFIELFLSLSFLELVLTFRKKIFREINLIDVAFFEKRVS